MKEFFTSTIIKSWLTTLTGFVAAVIQVLYPVISAGRMPTKQEWIQAGLMVIAGIVTKSGNVTGK